MLYCNVNARTRRRGTVEAGVSDLRSHPHPPSLTNDPRLAPGEGRSGTRTRRRPRPGTRAYAGS